MTFATSSEQSTTVCQLLKTYRFSFSNEADLQAGIARVLDAASISYRREVVLTRQDRPDFMLDGGLAIEVKVGGSVSNLRRQVERYAALEAVTEIIVVSTRMLHRTLPEVVNGKPVHVVHLMGSVL